LKSSRIQGFFRLSSHERLELIKTFADLSDQDVAILADPSLGTDRAELMIENAVGVFSLPLGVAPNFLINKRDYLVPMAIEEPSVLAAVSNAARLVRLGGGFQTESTPPIMIGQLQIMDVLDIGRASSIINDNRANLLARANEQCDRMQDRGGGARNIVVRVFPETSVGPMMVLHLHFDSRDAMGANAINTALEALAPEVEQLTGGRVNLRILSNLTDQRMATARCLVPASALKAGSLEGTSVARLIEEANAFAVVDPYRAATHNKGIMNGIDAVCIATGNDWRAVEAGAHAYAARNGRYSSLTDWHVDQNGDLYGEMTIPLAVGIVGGATKVHPTAQVALKVLGVRSAMELAEVMAAVGLAQNLAAIRALATTGIQHGHMRLHSRQVALAAGAENSEVQHVVDQMVDEGDITPFRAIEIVAQLRDRQAVQSSVKS